MRGLQDLPRGSGLQAVSSREASMGCGSEQEIRTSLRVLIGRDVDSELL